MTTIPAPPLQLRGEPVIPLDRGTVQVGTGATAVRIRGPYRDTVAAVKMLAERRQAGTYGGISAGDTTAGDTTADDVTAPDASIPDAPADDASAPDVPADLAAGTKGPRPRRRHARLAEELLAELADAGFPVDDAGAERSRDRRRVASVLVEGLCATGTELVGHLLAEGVGTLVLRDIPAATAGRAAGPAPGSPRSGSRAVDRTSDRAVALARRLRIPQRHQAVLVSGPAESPPETDVCVVVRSAEGYDPALAAALEAHTSRSAVLPIRVGRQSCGIGPLLTPSGGVCGACLTLQADERDPLRHALRRQMERAAQQKRRVRPHAQTAPAGTGSGQAASEPTVVGGIRAGDVARRQPSPVVRSWCAAAAARQVLTLLDGVYRPAADGHAITMDALTGVSVQRPVYPHPECECRTRYQPQRDSGTSQ